MKKIVFLLGFFMIACGPNPPKESPKPLPVSEKTTLEEGTPYIVGKINRSNLLTYEHSQWYAKEYDFFKIDSQWIETITPLTQGVSYQLFLGTWCEDSQREVPGMLKILDALGTDPNAIDMYAMDEDKRTPENYEQGLDINNVPTLIFYKDGKEMNRIVEMTVASIYKDMAKIYQNEPYQHAYFEAETP